MIRTKLLEPSEHRKSFTLNMVKVVERRKAGGSGRAGGFIKWLSGATDSPSTERLKPGDYEPVSRRLRLEGGSL